MLPVDLHGHLKTSEHLQFTASMCARVQTCKQLCAHHHKTHTHTRTDVRMQEHKNSHNHACLQTCLHTLHLYRAGLQGSAPPRGRLARLRRRCSSSSCQQRLTSVVMTHLTLWGCSTQARAAGGECPARPLGCLMPPPNVFVYVCRHLRTCVLFSDLVLTPCLFDLA